MLSTLNQAFETVVQISWQASVLVLLILLAQRIFRKQLSPRWRCAMWGLLLIRLAMPVLPESRWSIFAIVSDPGQESLIHGDTRTQIIYSDSPNERPQSNAIAASLDAMPRTLPPTRIDAMDLIAGIWFVGFVFIVARFLVASREFRVRVRRTAACQNQTLLREVVNLCAQVGVKEPRVIESSWVAVPALYGVWRPLLLLPMGLSEKLSREQLRFILMHELAHLKRRDVLFGCLMWLACAVHWFNPILWLAAARFRRDRELACDAHVLNLCGPAQSRQYGLTILQLMDFLHSPNLRFAPGAAAILEDRSSLRERIDSIANPIRTLRAWSVFAVILSVGLTMVACTSPRKPTAKQSAPATLVTRTYHASDLTAAFDATQPASTFSVTAGSPPNVLSQPTSNTAPGQLHGTIGPPKRPSSRDIIKRLMTLLENTVDPGSWVSRGGLTGRMEMVGDDQLVITQTQENQDKIASYIGEKSIQIILETKFLTGDAVFAALEGLNDGKSNKWNATGGFETWPEFLSEEQVNTILRTTQTDLTSTILTAPRLTLFNGQQAFIVVSTDTAYVADLKPLADGTFEPVVDVISSGVHLDCRAQMDAGSSFVTIDLHPKMTVLLALQPEPRWNVQNGNITQAFVQIPTVRKLEFKQTFNMPPGKWALFRGVPQVTPVRPDAQPEQALLIMVRPTVVSQLGG